MTTRQKALQCVSSTFSDLGVICVENYTNTEIKKSGRSIVFEKKAEKKIKNTMDSNIRQTETLRTEAGTTRW